MQEEGDVIRSLDVFDRRSAVTPEIPVRFEGATGTQAPRYSELAGGAEAKIQRPGGFFQTLKEGLLQGGQPTAEVAPPVAERFQQLLRGINAPFEAIARGVAGPVSETGLVSPQTAEAIGEGTAAVAGMIPVAPGRTLQAVRGIGRPRPPVAAPPAAAAVPEVIPLAHYPHRQTW